MAKYELTDWGFTQKPCGCATYVCEHMMGQAHIASQAMSIPMPKKFDEGALSFDVSWVRVPPEDQQVVWVYDGPSSLDWGKIADAIRPTERGPVTGRELMARENFETRAEAEFIKRRRAKRAHAERLERLGAHVPYSRRTRENERAAILARAMSVPAPHDPDIHTRLMPYRGRD